MNRSVWLLLVGINLLACSVELPKEVAEAYEDLPQEIDFNFHVRPILSDRCYKCHGPDEEARKADLRLDLQEQAQKAFKKGNIGRSPLVHRILSTDPEEMMPPEDSNLALTDKEKAILVKWIEQGAHWKEHWAFIPLESVPVPDLTVGSPLAKNEIDQFVLEKLEMEGLNFNEESSKERLLRRVTMDITGLPPTYHEIQDFLNDQSADAYEKVVDRLLSSAACAERLAMDWMDLARYADSHGLHADGWRMMWPWRDWVIKAFQANMPYDEFVTWQLAGDLLPQATRDQKLATAFNRNHPMTAEGGAIEEEFRLSYVFDRAETTGTAFLGLTMNCARCHDHKFDPISQKDYYQFAAFFNNIKELGMTGDDGNYGPMLPLVDGEKEQLLKFLETEIKTKESEMDSLSRQLAGQTPQLLNELKMPEPLGRYPLDQLRKQRIADLDPPAKPKTPLKSLVVDDNPRATTPGIPELVPGKVGNGLQFTGNYDELYLNKLPNFEWTQSFSGGMWFNTTKKEKNKTQTLMGTAGEKNNFWRGWDLYLDSSNRLNFRLIHSLPHNYLHAVTLDSIPLDTWTQVFFAYNGSGKGRGITLYVNGVESKSEIKYDRLYKSSKTVGGGAHELTDRPVRVAKSYRSFTGENGVFKGVIDEIEIYREALTGLEVASIYERAAREDPLSSFERSNLKKLHWQYHQATLRSYRQQLEQLRDQWLTAMEPVPEVMVMEEMPQIRTAYAYRRGAYDAPMYKVAAGTPTVLNEFPSDLPSNRLGLAIWLFRKENPLTARVTVNRYWQMMFGKGLVKTAHDFGVQGSLPTHPALLDWLAGYFQDQHWDVRALLKIMVMSHTYRQSSDVEKGKLEKDPENLLLSRGASYRLPAEMIRDNALAASGLLVNQIGGESVRPYQPEGLWIDKGNFSHKLLRYIESKGDSLYRRSLYTFVKRTSPHPAMTAFDAPSRDVCTLKRENTNTPLQALVLLNDPQFVECSRVLAERVQREAGDSLDDQIIYAFQLVTGRKPRKEEVEVFRSLFNSQKRRFQSDTREVDKLLAVGEYPNDPRLDPVNTAALTVVSNTIINHDEAYMKR